jgi:hypothetical protein
MSDYNQNSDHDLSFVKEVNTNVSTDTITDLKSGIFNLFANLYNNLSLEYGPVNAIKMSIGYLNDIIQYFQNTLEENDTNN